MWCGSGNIKCTVSSVRLALMTSSDLTQMDILVLIVGALCHDIDHPGLNNMYQVNTRYVLHVIYFYLLFVYLLLVHIIN